MSSINRAWIGAVAGAAALVSAPSASNADSTQAKPMPVAFVEAADITLKGNGFSDLEMSNAARIAQEKSNCTVTYNNEGVFEGGIEIIGQGVEDVAFDPTEAGLLAARLCRS